MWHSLVSVCGSLCSFSFLGVFLVACMQDLRIDSNTFRPVNVIANKNNGCWRQIHCASAFHVADSTCCIITVQRRIALLATGNGSRVARVHIRLRIVGVYCQCGVRSPTSRASTSSGGLLAASSWPVGATTSEA